MHNSNPRPFTVTSDKVKADRGANGMRVLATVPIAAGEPILFVDGVVVDRPSRYSIQIGKGQHIDPDVAACAEDDMAKHPWRFLNHACEPNAWLRGRTLMALRPIAAGAEVTFDYTTTEYEMACPFACHCGAASCLGMVAGYRALSAERRRRIAAHVAEHLRPPVVVARTDDLASR